MEVDRQTLEDLAEDIRLIKEKISNYNEELIIDMDEIITNVLNID